MHCNLCSIRNRILPSQGWPNDWQSSTRWNISGKKKKKATHKNSSSTQMCFIFSIHLTRTRSSNHLFLTLSSWCKGTVSSSGSSSSCTTAVCSPIPMFWSHSLTFNIMLNKNYIKNPTPSQLNNKWENLPELTLSDTIKNKEKRMKHTCSCFSWISSIITRFFNAKCKKNTCEAFFINRHLNWSIRTKD